MIRPLSGAIAVMALLAVFKLGAAVQGTVVPAARAATHEPAAAPAAPPAPPEAAPEPQPPSEPPISDAERGVLQDLRARRTALDARAEALSARESVLAAAETRLSGRLAELTAVQQKLEAMEQVRKDREEANWHGLVKTYETMRPRDAAVIFNDLEQPILMEVLDRMKDAKAAPILAAMTPDRARAATAQLAQWRARTTGAGG